jgi:glycosyltransferase involved in cell wall biosynthesis
MTSVLFLSPHLNTGGAERQWAILIPLLAERGLTVSVLTVNSEGPFFADLLERGITCRCAQIEGRLDVAGFRRLKALVTEQSPQVLVTQGVNAFVAAELLKRSLGAAHVLTQHSVPEHPQSRLQRLLIRAFARRLEGAVIIADEQVDFMLSLGFRTGQLRLIPNGTPEPRPTLSATEARGLLGLAAEDFVCVLVAALRPEKRVGDFVAAVARAHDRDSRIRGVVCGDGPEADAVRRAADGTDGVVHLLGHRDDVPDIVAASDVACLTSSAETVPMALLEAMALGRPVVASDVGAVRHVVDGSGIVAPPRDVEAFAQALLLLAGDPDLAAGLGAAGRARYEELFAAGRMADEYASFLHEVASRSRVVRAAAQPTETMERPR